MQKLDDSSEQRSDIKKKMTYYRKIFYKYNLQYIDFDYGKSLNENKNHTNQNFIYFRFKNESQAQMALLDEPGGVILEKISGEQELSYWKHILACWSDGRTKSSRSRQVSKKYRSKKSYSNLREKVKEANDNLVGQHVKLY